MTRHAMHQRRLLRCAALAATIAGASCALDEPPGLSHGDLPPLEIDPGPRLYHVDVASARELTVLLDHIHSVDGRLRVPNLAPVRLPGDIEALETSRRKAVFFRSLLPLIVHENERVLAERRKLVQILVSGGPRSTDEEQWLADLVTRYRVVAHGDLDVELLRRTLLPRVDVVPAPLVLAQAAIESAWGTSRFAKDANALFGQWTSDPRKPGLVPAARDSGAAHRIEAFPSIHASIRGYMRNLNTHRAYGRFRALRHTQRRQGKGLDSFALAETLDRYSARGLEYVDEIQAIMRQNGLRQYANAEIYRAGVDLVARFEVTNVDDPGIVVMNLDSDG